VSLAIGVDVGGTKVAAGVVDEQGRILAKLKRSTPAATEPVRSRLSDKPGGATCKAARPEKTDCSARFSRGLGPRKR